MPNVDELIQHIVPKEMFTLRSDGSFEERAQHLIDQCFPAATGMEMTQLSGDAAEARIPSSQGNRALHGFMHGGCYFTVGDTLTAIMCLFHVEKESERMLTVNASVRYLRPVKMETVTAKALLVKRDGQILDFVCDFFNEAGKRAAQGKYKYALAEMG